MERILALIKLDREAVGIGDKDEFFTGVLVYPHGLCRYIPGFEVIYRCFNTLHFESQMAQACCFGPRYTRRWVWKRKELDNVNTLEREIQLVGLPLFPVHFPDYLQAEDLCIKCLRDRIIRTDNCNMVDFRKMKHGLKLQDFIETKKWGLIFIASRLLCP